MRSFLRWDYREPQLQEKGGAYGRVRSARSKRDRGQVETGVSLIPTSRLILELDSDAKVAVRSDRY